jgi:PGAP1-like protein
MISPQLAECCAISHFLEKYDDVGIQIAVRQDLVGKAQVLSAEEIAYLVEKRNCNFFCPLTQSYGPIFSKLTKKVVEHQEANMNPTGCIIFVHGLGSSHLKTWIEMENLVKSHSVLREQWVTKQYDYVTTKLKLMPEFISPRRYLGIPMLAKGLKSFIELHCKTYESIVIVGHSMGGLVTAKFVTTELGRMTDHRVKGALFFAAPFDGSQLATIADVLSIKHKQVRSMMKDSDDTHELIERFKEIVLVSNFPHVIVVGGQDKAVPPEKFFALFGHNNTFLLPNEDHQSITRSADHNSDSFIILKSFLDTVSAQHS